METLESLRSYALSHAVPIIREESAKFLQNQVGEFKPNEILEIGTAIGYSGSLILEAAENAKLTTIEIDEKSFSKAEQTFLELGLTPRVKSILGDAKDVLEDLVRAEKRFDFIFLDGPKGQYIKYLPLCKKLLSNGGVIFADNVLLHGLVLSQEKICHKHRTMVTNMRKFLQTLLDDADFDAKLYKIEDGIAVARLKNNINQQKN